MTEFKKKIDLTVKLSQLMVDLAGDTLTSQEQDELFEDYFTFYKALLPRYNQKTLECMTESTNLILEFFDENN